MLGRQVWWDQSRARLELRDADGRQGSLPLRTKSAEAAGLQRLESRTTTIGEKIADLGFGVTTETLYSLRDGGAELNRMEF